MKSLLASLALAGFGVLAAPVAAQDKVYRCGADGRTYSAAPCPGGREVPVADPRSAAQQDEARDHVGREAALAERLASERHARERAARRQGGPAGIVTARRDRLATTEPKSAAKDKPRKRHALHKQGAADDPFTARGKP